MSSHHTSPSSVSAVLVNTVFARQRRHRVRVGALVRARRHTEEAVLGVDGVEPPVRADLHPRDVVADRLDRPPGQRRNQHREVRLPAGGRERSRHVPHDPFGVGDLEDEHVLGEPAFVARDHRRDPQREALLAQERVPPVARSEAPDLACLGKMDDPLLVRVARPGNVFLARLQRRTDRVHTGHELAVVAEHVERALTGPGHRAHADGDVGGVGDLHADVGERGTERAHAERHDVHRAAAHRAAEQVMELRPHLRRRLPVVRRPGVVLPLRADEGAVLHAGDVAGVGVRPVGAGALPAVEADERARVDQLFAEELPLGVGSVEPVHRVRLAERRDLVDPVEQSPMLGLGVDGRHALSLPGK